MAIGGVLSLGSAIVLALFAAIPGSSAKSPVDTLEHKGRAWYVDCANGDDRHDGVSPATAWKSVRAVSDRVFRAGDSIYFRRGSVCPGTLLPNGSGSATEPIHLDAWGIGPLPRIQAQAGQEAALKLFDQQYWTVEHLDFSGGETYGIFISGSKGVLRGIHIRDVVVHSVTGEPKDKEQGLVIIASGTERQHFDDVLIDGVTAYGTSRWVGIMVAGVGRGFPPETSRNTNVVIRNSIAHDVAGDGIVLFQVNSGLIENSVAWHTGMQDTETIGTPNAIWTWMCRNCTVRRSEAFLTDSPGVDGGAFDIDYGNDNNTVEENYAHDTQGYCVAVFGAGWVTRNSVVRNNVCVANGLSPRLARRQGAIFLSTWNEGQIQGLQISGNRIFWDPPLASAAIVNVADFVGTASFNKNRIQSSSPFMIRSNRSLIFDENSYEYSGRGETGWRYGGKTYDSFDSYLTGSGQDKNSQETRGEQNSREARLPGMKLPVSELRDDSGNVVEACAGRFPCLLAVVSAGEDNSDSRGEVTMVKSVHRQFPNLQIQIIVDAGIVLRRDKQKNLRYDWNTGDIPVSFGAGTARDALKISQIPTLVLTDASQNIVWRQNGFTAPAKLGLSLRRFLGSPKYGEMAAKQ